MMKHLRLCLFLGFLISCSSDDKPIDFVFDNVTYGSFLRTIGFSPADLMHGDTQSVFRVEIEQQDSEDGSLLAAVNVYADFIDNNPDNGIANTQETFLTRYEASDFIQGPVGLPRIKLEYSYLDLLNITGLGMSQTACKDQFLIRLEIELTDGRTFTTGSGSSCIIAYESYFSSPYRYLINIVEPVPEDLFTGTYKYTSVLDGPTGPTFGPSQFVEITAGPKNNVREMRFFSTIQDPSHGAARPFYFSLVCDQAVFWENQLRKLSANCSEIGNDVLLGPGAVNSTITPLEDSVFELWLTEGYLGFDGGSGFGEQPSRIRLDKQ